MHQHVHVTNIRVSVGANPKGIISIIHPSICIPNTMTSIFKSINFLIGQLKILFRCAIGTVTIMATQSLALNILDSASSFSIFATPGSVSKGVHNPTPSLDACVSTRDPLRSILTCMIDSKKSEAAASAQEVEPKCESVSGGLSCQPRWPPHLVSTMSTLGLETKYASLLLLGSDTKKSSLAVRKIYGTEI